MKFDPEKEMRAAAREGDIVLDEERDEVGVTLQGWRRLAALAIVGAGVIESFDSMPLEREKLLHGAKILEEASAIATQIAMEGMAALD